MRTGGAEDGSRLPKPLNGAIGGRFCTRSQMRFMSSWEIVFGEVTTGASNDLEKVTATAKQMVMRFGMSEKLGPRVLGRGHDQPFLGRDYGAEADYSEEIAREIDDEVRRIIEDGHELALRVLREHMCMEMRGIRKVGARTVTSAVRGAFQRDGKVRAEAMALINAR